MLEPEETKIVMILLAAVIIAIVGCCLPVGWTTGVTIILPIQLVILFTLTLRVMRITWRMSAQEI